MLVQYLRQHSEKDGPWVREPLSGRYAHRADLVLYHRGALQHFFVTDSEGERMLAERFRRGDDGFVVLRGICGPESDHRSDPREMTVLPGVNIEITTHCTARCRYCYLGATANRRNLSSKLLSLLLIEGEKMGLRHVTITGGEPFADNRLLPILEVLSERNISASVLTNGDLITQETVDRLARIRDSKSWGSSAFCGVCGRPVGEEGKRRPVCPNCLLPLVPFLFQISLDSAEPPVHDLQRGEGSHARALKAIRGLRAKGFAVSVSQTVTARTVETDPAEYLDLVRDLGVAGVRVGLLEWEGAALSSRELIAGPSSLFDYYRALVDALDTMNRSGTVLMVAEIAVMRGALANVIPKRGCLHCKAIHVTASGDVLVCPFCPSPVFNLGKIGTKSLHEIIAAKQIRAAHFLSMADHVASCERCRYRTVCGGGCRGNGLHATGRLDGADPYCGFYQSFFTYLLGTLTRFPKSPRNLTAQTLREV